MDADDWLIDTQVSYDTVAASYADQVRGILGDKPYLRAALDLFADKVRAVEHGPVADVGCGPGHVTAYLRALGLDAFGIDLSPVMIDVARREQPGVRFEVGSMTDLDLADASVAGLLPFWSLVHVPDHELPGVFSQFRRVVRPGGALLVAGRFPRRCRIGVEERGLRRLPDEGPCPPPSARSNGGPAT